jgi:hypothetical protein
MKADNQKTKKEAKLKAAEEKKLATSTCKMKRAAKKQEKLIFDAKSKLAKATAKAEELCLKLAEAIKAGSGDTPLTAAGLTSLEDLEQHSHKKSKQISGWSLAGIMVLSQSYLSPQRK